MTQQVDSHRRQEILSAAAGLFRRQGFERTSVRQIAAELGIKSGSLFYHFATKEELLVAVMEEGIRDVHASVQEGLASEHRLPEQLLAMVRRHLTALLGANLDALMVLVYEWRSLSEPAVRRVMAWRNRYEDLWDQAIGAAAANGWVDSDVVLVRQTVLGALNWAGQWYRASSRLSVDALSTRMFAILMPEVHGQLGRGSRPGVAHCACAAGHSDVVADPSGWAASSITPQLPSAEEFR